MWNKFKANFIGDKAFYKELMRLVIPMIIQQGITSFVGLLDNVMVGRLGTESMSGVAIVNQLLFVFNLAIFGGLAGASIFGAQFYGNGDHKGVRYAFRFKLLFGLICTVLGTVALLVGGDQLVHMFLTDDGSGSDLLLTFQEAKIYLVIMLVGLLPFVLSQSYSSTLREAGETVAPMAASVIAILTNLVLNYLLIFGALGFPALGVAGAAIATVISRIIEAAYLMVHAHRHVEKYPFMIHLYRSMYVPGIIVRKIMITGTPLMLNELLWSVGITIINQAYSTRGLTVVAATNITTTIWNLFCVIMFAMGNVVSIMIGQQLGAGQIEEAKRTDNRLLFFTVILHVAIGGLIAVTAPFIPMIYNTEPAVQQTSTQMLFVAGAVLPFQAFVHVVYFTIRSGGKTFITFLFDCVFTWVVPLPIAFFLCHYTALPVVLIYLLVQGSDIIKLAIGIPLLKSGFWANNVINDTSEAVQAGKE